MRSAILFRMQRALGRRGPSPGSLGPVRGVEREVDVLAGGAGDLGERLAGDRGDVLEVLALDRRHPLAADEVAVAVRDRHRAVGLPRGRVMRHRWFPFLRCWSSGEAGEPGHLWRPHWRHVSRRNVATTLQPRFRALSRRARRRAASTSPRPAAGSGELARQQGALAVPHLQVVGAPRGSGSSSPSARARRRPAPRRAASRAGRRGARRRSGASLCGSSGPRYSQRRGDGRRRPAAPPTAAQSRGHLASAAGTAGRPARRRRAGRAAGPARPAAWRG